MNFYYLFTLTFYIIKYHFFQTYTHICMKNILFRYIYIYIYIETICSLLYFIRSTRGMPACFQCSSLNESTAKKICRKQPLGVVAHAETQLIRTYPAGMRIDSTNFNPVIFWAFGIQMVALNYQTDDAGLNLNTAMFEQNGQCGYVRKPSVMWDKGHMMYR